MRPALRRLFILFVVAAVVAAAIWYASRPVPLTVALATVTRGEVRANVANTRAGTVKACHRARLSPPLGGQIASLPAKEGMQVEADQVLLELWNDDLQSDLLLARREVDAARARAEEACVGADVARRESQRFSRLRAQGLSTEEQADVAEGKARATGAACNATRALIAVSEARVESARARLERTILRAPFAGTIAEVNGELGEFVTPSPVGIPTPPAVDLVDNSCLYVSAPIDEVDAPAIRAGMPARITLDAFADREFPGTVRRVAPYVLDIEKQARTVDVEAEFDNPADNLLPGYSADVEVVLSVRRDVLRVPSQAVLSNNRVLVYSENLGVLEERTLETGLSNWEYTEVLSGLSAGDRVVVSVDRAGVVAGAAVEPE